MAYSIEIREEVLEKIKSGCSIKMVSSEYGISTATICRWKVAREKDNNEVAVVNKIQEVENRKVEISNPVEEASKRSIPTKVDIDCLSQEIARLSKMGKFQEALKLCDSGSFNRLIQHQKAIILVRLADTQVGEEKTKSLQEAVAICDRNIEKKPFVLLKNKIKGKFPKFVVSEEKKESLDSKIELLGEEKTIIKNIIAKIYCDFITEEEIKEMDIDPWYKNLLLVAYYEKTNRSTKLFLAKKLKEENKEDEQKVKFLNQLIQKFSSRKNGYFDFTVYTNYFHCSLDYNLVKQYEKEKQEKELEEAMKLERQRQENVVVTNEIKPIEKKKQVKEKAPKKIISVVGQRVTARYHHENSSSTTVNDEQELLIKDVFANEIFELGRQIYIQMYNPENRMRGMDAWDRLEALKMKSADDIWALNSMINLIDRINLKEPGFIKTNDERNVQLIKKAKEKQKSKKL